MGTTLESKLRLSLIDDVSARAKKITGALGMLGKNVPSPLAPFRGMVPQILALGGAYVGLTQTIEGTYTASAKMQAAMTEIGIKSGLSKTALGQMQAQLTRLSPKVNQFTSDLTDGVDVMLTMGASSDEAMGAIPSIGKTATATGAAIADLSGASVSAMQNLSVMPGQIQQMLEGMTSAGNSGAFEIKDMAQYFPQLTASAKALGMKGVPAVNDMAAALQIARRGAGDASTAANNMSDFMGKIMTPQTIKNFKKFGVNVTQELQKAHKKGVSPIEHFIKLIDQKTNGGQGDLLTQIFGDKQTLDFIRPMISGFQDYQKIRSDADRANGVIADAYNRRMDDANQKVKAFQIGMSNLGTSIGSYVLKPVGDAAQYVADVLDTLDQRVTIFDRLKAGATGFLSGFGMNSGELRTFAKDMQTFFFGTKDSSKAADEYGAIFKRFRDWGSDVSSLNAAINASPILKFLRDLGLSIGLLAVTKWARMFAVAAGISALIGAVRGADSIGAFVENLRGLSALEWAGVGAGLLMIATRANRLIGVFKKLAPVMPKQSLPKIGPGVGPAGVSGLGSQRAAPISAPAGVSWGGFLKSSLKGGVLAGLVGYLGETAIRSGFQAAYGDNYREPPDRVLEMATAAVSGLYGAMSDQSSQSGGGNAARRGFRDRQQASVVPSAETKKWLWGKAAEPGFDIVADIRKGFQKTPGRLEPTEPFRPMDFLRRNLWPEEPRTPTATGFRTSIQGASAPAIAGPELAGALKGLADIVRLSRFLPPTPENSSVSVIQNTLGLDQTPKESKPVVIDQASIGAIIQPSGIQQVHVMNNERPNVSVTLSMSNSFTSPSDPNAASKMAQQAADSIRSAVEGAFSD